MGWLQRAFKLPSSSALVAQDSTLIVPKCAEIAVQGELNTQPNVPHCTPEAILELGHLFWPSRILLTAIELELFTKLAKAPNGRMTNPEIRQALGLHKRATPDFTDALVALNMLQRDGNGTDDPEECVYYNTPETALFLDKTRDSYVGKHLEVCATRTYRVWADHGELLKDKSRRSDTLRNVIDSCNQHARVMLFKASRVGATGTTAEEKKLSAEQIIDLGFGFWTSRMLLTAIEWRLFTMIEARKSRRMTADRIRKAYNLGQSTTSEFLDGLVDLKMLQREGMPNTKDAVYSNTPEGALFLDRNKASYVGAIMEMVSNRTYRFWADLAEALRTGERQNESKHTGEDVFQTIYSDRQRLEEFVFAMLGISHGGFTAFAKSFDFKRYKTMVDIGGASGQLSCYVAQNHPHMQCVTTDLAPVLPIAERWIAKWGCEKQVKPIVLDYFTDPFPKADLITMGMILHDLGIEHKKMLIRKAYDALPPGGALVSIETIIDDDRRKNSMGLCMSLHMMIEFGAEGGFDFTGADFNRWCLEAGFKRTEVCHLLGPTSAAIAYK